jgi:hypothetical protein
MLMYLLIVLLASFLLECFIHVCGILQPSLFS